DVREMMSLAQHLRADERLCLAAPKAIEDLHERAFLARRVAIENILDDSRKIAVKTLFDFFRAEADRLQHFAAAQRTLRRNRLAQSAVVTDEKSGAAMHRHRHAAIAAAEFVSAFAAQQIRRITASIDQDDGLLACRECLAQLFAKRRAEDHESFVFFLR